MLVACAREKGAALGARLPQSSSPFTAARPLGRLLVRFFVFLHDGKRIKKTCFSCIAPKGDKSKNRWPLVASRSDFWSIFNDLGRHFGIDFPTFLEHRICVDFSWYFIGFSYYCNLWKSIFARDVSQKSRFCKLQYLTYFQRILHQFNIISPSFLHRIFIKIPSFFRSPFQRPFLEVQLPV